MKRRKINIFVLTVIGILTAIIEIIRKTFVVKGQTIDNIEYKSENLIIHVNKQGGKKNLVIIGSGYSLSIDENNKVIKHDLFLSLYNAKGYSKNTTVMSIFYPFESKGLQQAGKELSDFINSKLKEYEEITLIGHSKCGVCFANAAKWIERKINIVTVSASFYGTPVADKEKIEATLKGLQKKVALIIFGNHNVDKDIMINSKFMRVANYSALENHNHINVMSTCPKKSFNPIDLLLMYVDKKGVNGDGIAPFVSQKLKFKSTTTVIIEKTHAHSLSKAIGIIKQYIPNL